MEHTDEKQAEGHMFTCSCGNLCINECAHCDRLCWNRRCKSCNTVIEDKDIRNAGKTPEAFKAWMEGNK